MGPVPQLVADARVTASPPTVAGMTDLGLPPALVRELDKALDERVSPLSRAALLRGLIWQVYTRVRAIDTGDGMDGHDSPERAVIGQIYAKVDTHFFDVAKQDRQH